MKKFAAAIALAGALLASLAGTACAHTDSAGRTAVVPPVNYGVADDTGKYADDGGAWFDTQLHGANLTQERSTLSRSPSSRSYSAPRRGRRPTGSTSCSRS